MWHIAPPSGQGGSPHPLSRWENVPECVWKYCGVMCGTSLLAVDEGLGAKV